MIHQGLLLHWKARMGPGQPRSRPCACPQLTPQAAAPLLLPCWVLPGGCCHTDAGRCASAARRTLGLCLALWLRRGSQWVRQTGLGSPHHHHWHTGQLLHQAAQTRCAAAGAVVAPLLRRLSVLEQCWCCCKVQVAAGRVPAHPAAASPNCACCCTHAPPYWWVRGRGCGCFHPSGPY